MQLVAHDAFTLDDVQYYNDLFLVRMLSLAGYVILIHEAFEALPDEVKHIWPARWSTVKVLYLINRYGNLVFLGASTLQTLGIWRSNAHTFCYNATLALSLIQFASFASVHVLVLLRAWATWGRHVKILAILAALFVLYAAASVSLLVWGVVSVGYNAYPLASIVGTCISSIPCACPTVSSLLCSPFNEVLLQLAFAWILWIPSLALECVIFILTMVSIRQFDLHLHLAWQSPIVRVIMRDAILYFSLTLFSGLFNIFIWAYYAERALNMLANSFTLCLMISAGQRLVLDLRKISTDDALSTTRIGREVERAIEAMATARSPSPIVFAERSLASPTTHTSIRSHDTHPPSPWKTRKVDWGAIRHWVHGVDGREQERSISVELVEVVDAPSDGRRTRTLEVHV
ncbi:hypothetical protein DICSQDRAFT_161121 [Dichomitus squalens LYAD-421 SS1]|uniref:DUF6533 domain-containing protein n=1 Tax=Dichomitus squalens (strain LYAD-421) TaxID=732165 RepID=R7T1M4_DICSQ|nr:uncharacterized protein DICSQDRAFT_161121 [Dichomitus squalens LYAD-421 SS1]EJF62251.1 hypothetical protein DICSQDRAFT_161121 [Dichomitus squalens LYAD-421 SS1]